VDVLVYDSAMHSRLYQAWWICYIAIIDSLKYISTLLSIDDMCIVANDLLLLPLGCKH